MYDSFGIQRYNILNKHSASYEDLTRNSDQIFL